jgi:hypothetical protein
MTSVTSATDKVLIGALLENALIALEVVYRPTMNRS